MAVGATFMALAWEKTKVIGRILWVLMLFALLRVESRAIDKDHFDADRRETALAGETHSLVTQFGILMPEINGLGNQLSQIQLKMGAARGNPSQTALLKAQLDSVRRQYDAAKQELALAFVQNPPPPTISTPTPTPSTAPNLRDQGLQLARDINDWITSVSKDVPPSSSDPILPDKQKDQYVARLNSEWSDRFQTRVDSLIGPLQVSGIRLACIPLSDEEPSFILSMRKSCAEHIEQAALRQFFVQLTN